MSAAGRAPMLVTTTVTITATSDTWRKTLDGILTRAQDLLQHFDVEELTITKTDGQVLIGGALVKAHYRATMTARPIAPPKEAP